MFLDIQNATGETVFRVNLERIELIGQEPYTVWDEDKDEEIEYTRYFIGVSGNLINVDENSYNSIMKHTNRYLPPR